MNKLLIMVLVIAALFTTGCYVYGSGKTYGYVTTVEDGIFWDKAWFRAELESSQTDCYVLNSNNLKEQLRQTSEAGQRVEMSYRRHFITLGCSSDQASSVRVVN